jgi:uncharacterized Zn-binding protein involved in type VI secretion
MLRRYHITLGAKTTAGGVVATASTISSINGATMAVEGDHIDCPACRTKGVIQAVPPRIPDRFNGKEFALSDDLCICKCNPPPKLIASQSLKCQTLALASVESAEEAAARAVSANVDAKNLVPIRLIDEATGRPHVNRKYRLQLADKVVEGVTDSDGLTKPLSKAERDALVAWSVAPAPSGDA